MVGRGKNYSKQDEEQLCRSFLHIGHGFDRIAGGTGQKLAAFWERVAAHYNDSTPPGSEVRPVRSLESKWSLIKGEVSKFSDFYDSAKPLDESASSRKDVIAKALELYQTAPSNTKQEEFKFLHCWEVLKEHPKWAALGEAQVVKAGETSGKKSVKRRRNSEEAENSSSVAPTQEFPVPPLDTEIQDEGVTAPFAIISQLPRPEDNGAVPSFDDIPKLLPPDEAEGNGAAKDGPETEAQADSGRMTQARAASELARAKLEKAKILKDQFLLQLFSTEVDEGDRELNREYVRLRKEEELDEIRARVARRRLEKASIV
ncbi:unnamed protein product [Calypogeia fissa]